MKSLFEKSYLLLVFFLLGFALATSCVPTSQPDTDVPKVEYGNVAVINPAITMAEIVMYTKDEDIIRFIDAEFNLVCYMITDHFVGHSGAGGVSCVPLSQTGIDY